jgi:hypothetical protein
MIIKDKTLALAAEHGIEIWWPKGLTKNDDKSYQINLPAGFELPDGTTGLSVDHNTWISDYQNWKGLLGDVKELVEQKSNWREIAKVGA